MRSGVLAGAGRLIVRVISILGGVIDVPADTGDDGDNYDNEQCFDSAETALIMMGRGHSYSFCF